MERTRSRYAGRCFFCDLRPRHRCRSVRSGDATGLANKSVRVRMGLHTGEPLIAATGYVGMDVHRAARIGDASHGGQVLLSQTTRELVINGLPNGVTIRDLGEHRL